jgi:hypothetical protein
MNREPEQAELVEIEKRIFRALAVRSNGRRRELREWTGLSSRDLHRGLMSLIEVGAINGGVHQVYSLTESGREHYETFVGPAPAPRPRIESDLKQGRLF